MSTVTMETSKGVLKIELFDEQAPRTTQNFKDLIAKGYYDGLIFHRVIKGFMIQGGCPQGLGMGGPGYTFEDEFHEDLRHDAPGVLSMANSGPDTNGSQFFITTVPTPHLNDRHSVFGKVTEGMDVLSEIEGAPTGANDKPLEAITMTSVTLDEG